MSDITTIKISKKGRDKLKAIGKKGESYENILMRLLAYYEEKEDKKE